MSGHSHWANIKRKKEAQDKKKSVFFSKAAKMIMTAIKEGGAEPSTNINLRIAIEYAKKVNMPNANIERLIRKYGSKDTSAFKEIVYEGLFRTIPILIRVLTDNTNRSLTEVKQVFNEFGGHLAEKGAVSWQFKQVGLIVVSIPDGIDREELLFRVMELIDVVDIIDDLGRDDASKSLNLIVQRDMLKHSVDLLSKADFKVVEAHLQYIYTGPRITVTEEVQQRLKDLVVKLKDLDDVSEVWTALM